MDEWQMTDMGSSTVPFRANHGPAIWPKPKMLSVQLCAK